MCLLDTDHVSELQSNTGAGRILTARIGQIAPDDYGTTIITFEEQMWGRLAQVAASDRAAPQSVLSYALLNATHLFYYRVAVWQYTEVAARQFGLLREAGIRIGTQDLKIASIALSHGATLLTRNARDFTKVPGLLMDDWTS